MSTKQQVRPIERGYTPRHSTFITSVVADPIYVADLASDAASGFAPEDGFDSLYPTGDAWMIGDRVWIAYSYVDSEDNGFMIFFTRGSDDEFPVMAYTLGEAMDMTADETMIRHCLYSD